MMDKGKLNKAIQELLEQGVKEITYAITKSPVQ